MALSLSLLDRVADALSTCVVDDVHVGGRFAPQLASTINLVRKTIVRVASKVESTQRYPNHGVQNNDNGDPITRRRPATKNSYSTEQMLSPTQRTTLRKEAHPALAGHRHPDNQLASHSGRAVLTESEFATQPILGTTTHSLADRDPLHGIEPQYYDPANPAYTLMPPAGLWPPNDTSRNSAFAMSDEPADVSGQSGLDEFLGMDWFALPMDRLFPYSGQEVTTSSYGTDIGGMDMLDVLLTGTEGDIGGARAAKMGGFGPWTGIGYE